MEEIARLARDLAGHGVYTIADLHQDLLSRRFCGEGVPEGYLEDLLANETSPLSQARPFPEPVSHPLELDADGYPDLSACLKEPNFADFYASEQVGALFKQLYTQGTPLNDGFLRFWEAVAGGLGAAAGGAPHVLGYELINEPSTGRRPGVVFGNGLEVNTLTPLYRAAAARIRAVDPDRPIFYEANPYPMLFASPFPELPLGADTQQVFSYHVYCQADVHGVLNDIVCRAAQGLELSEYFGMLGAHRGLGAFMTEFGAIGTTAPEYEEIGRLLDAADGRLQSWAYWQLKKFHDLTTANAAEPLYDARGGLEGAKLKLLSRTYAQAIAGEPLRMSFQAGTAAFELEYNATVATAPTEVYLNEALFYPRGYQAEVEPAECVRQERLPNRLHLHLVAGGGRCVGRVIKLRVVATPATELVYM